MPRADGDAHARQLDVAGAISSLTTVGIATGLSFPDAFGWRIVGADIRTSVLASTASVASSTSSFFVDVNGTVTKAYLFGGTNALTGAVADGVNTELSGP